MNTATRRKDMPPPDRDEEFVDEIPAAQPRLFEAKYSGRCICCDEEIQPGDEIAVEEGQVFCRECAGEYDR